MSPVVLCFGALDAAVFAQAAYVVRDLTSHGSKPDERDSEKAPELPPR